MRTRLIVLAVLLAALSMARAQKVALVEASPMISDEVKELTWVGFQQLKDASRVFVRTNEAVRYKVSWKSPTELLVEFFNTKVLVRNNLRFLDTQFFDSPVLLIKPFVIEAVSPTTRITITVRHKCPFQVKQEDNLIFIDFRR